MQLSSCDKHVRCEHELVSNYPSSSLYTGTDVDFLCRSVSEISDCPLPSLTSQNEIGKLQCQDSDFGPIYKYLEANELPNDPKLVKQLVSERCQFDLVDDLLYYENPDLPGRWRIAVPQCLLLREAHGHW